MRALVLSLVALILAGVARADDVVRFDAERSAIVSEGADLVVAVGLSAPVPWRVFTLDEPRRLVLELRAVDWGGAAGDTLAGATGVGDVTLTSAPGLSRLVVGLSGPMRVATAGMAAEAGTQPLVTLRLVPTDAASFAAASVPDDPPSAPPRPEPEAAKAFVVVIDPGHGGVDPGAERDGAREADLMLALGRELAAALDETAGMAAVLTRTGDSFVPLPERMSLARAAGADVLVSLHADALEADLARGASVYTLSEAAGDSASARMAARHERGDLLAGLDLSGQDDTVATVLMDLARRTTGPAGERLAAALVTGLATAGATLNSRPRREAPLAVLGAADFPSALVETGFLSSGEDRAMLTTPEGRAVIVAGLVTGLQLFADGEADRRAGSPGQRAE